ncbi:LysE family transporter [Paraburkholderia sp. D15]|uniref:LysE family translocator n=1 Tax=Paraburkholderia sp. D15 TaxID=2880218 RepID=UPI00247A8F6C|nr:LysE family transporter [Paraburkholderia sp. D15]WGS54321.1 LysE family transporter [Paraburkholderia sp. D15]WKF60128.1 Threonine efflux protein [Paraburkholderia busanensis]
MDYVTTLLTLAGVLLLSVASPGPNFVIVTSTAVASRRAGVATSIGLAAASATWALIATAGLGLVLSHVSWIDTVLRTAGAIYLIWLGVKMIVTARRPLVVENKAVTSDWNAAKKGYFVSMTSPKSMAFYGSVFALLVPPHAPMWFGVTLVALAAAISLSWYGGLALLASQPAVSRLLVRRKATLEATAGVALVALGGRMLASR